MPPGECTWRSDLLAPGPEAGDPLRWNAHGLPSELFLVPLLPAMLGEGVRSRDEATEDALEVGRDLGCDTVRAGGRDAGRDRSAEGDRDAALDLSAEGALPAL